MRVQRYSAVVFCLQRKRFESGEIGQNVNAVILGARSVWLYA